MELQDGSVHEIRTRQSRRGMGALDIWIDGIFHGTLFPFHRGGWRAVARTGQGADVPFHDAPTAVEWLFAAA